MIFLQHLANAIAHDQLIMFVVGAIVGSGIAATVSFFALNREFRRLLRERRQAEAELRRKLGEARYEADTLQDHLHPYFKGWDTETLSSRNQRQP